MALPVTLTAGNVAWVLADAAGCGWLEVDDGCAWLAAGTTAWAWAAVGGRHASPNRAVAADSGRDEKKGLLARR